MMSNELVDVDLDRSLIAVAFRLGGKCPDPELRGDPVELVDRGGAKYRVHRNIYTATVVLTVHFLPRSTSPYSGSMACRTASPARPTWTSTCRPQPGQKTTARRTQRCPRRRGRGGAAEPSRSLHQQMFIEVLGGEAHLGATSPAHEGGLDPVGSVHDGEGLAEAAVSHLDSRPWGASSQPIGPYGSRFWFGWHRRRAVDGR